MRDNTVGWGVDPANMTPESDPMSFERFLYLWDYFMAFWLEHVGSQCTEIGVVRYEDLCDIGLIEEVLEKILLFADMESIGEGAIQHAVELYGMKICVTLVIAR